MFTLEHYEGKSDAWDRMLEGFDDANLIQTRSYGEARWGREHLSHTVLKKDGEIVAAAQAVIKRIPFFERGLAYIKSGPLWKPKGREIRIEYLRHMLRELRQCYVGRRRLLLRIFPADTEDGSGAIRSIFEQEALYRDLSIGTPKTVFIDLSYSLDELRSSLKRPWRHNLVQAEKNDLTIRHGVGEDLFEAFANLYGEMLRRKRITGVLDIARYQEMQKTLPPAWKMRVMICEHRGRPVAGIVVPFLGNTAHNLLAATGDNTGDLRGSYLLQWRMLEWLKSQQCRWYDLDAVNHDRYPGISQFKMGLAGKLGFEAEYAGQFEACSSPISRLCVRGSGHVFEAYRKTKAVLYGASNR